MQEKKQRIPFDQIICAIPAGLYLATPLLDIFINYYRSITNKTQYETFKVIPYLPAAIAGILFLSLIVFFVKSRDKNIFRITYHRTFTFQTTLLLFVIYLGLVMMSIAVNGFDQYAVHGHPYTKMSMWTYITNVLIYLFFSSLVYEERVKTFLVKLCCYVASAYALYSVLAHIFTKESRGLSGTFHNSNHYGYYLAVSIAVTSASLIHILSRKQNQAEGEDNGSGSKRDKIIDSIIWSLLLVVQCVALAYNDTLGAWLAVFAAYIFLFFAYRIKDGKWNFRVVIPLAVFVAVSIISSLFARNIFTSVARTVSDIGNIAAGAENAGNAGSGRWKIWIWTVRHILDRPIFGNGIEGILKYTLLEGISTGSPHNEFLEYMVFFGVPAGLAYIAGCVSVFLHGLKYRKELNPITLICMAGALSYLASSFFGVCFYYTVVYNFIFLGLSLNFAGKDRPKLQPVEAEEETDRIDPDQTDPGEGSENIDSDTVEESVQTEGADEVGESDQTEDELAAEGEDVPEGHENDENE